MDARTFDLHTFTEKLAVELGPDWEAITPGDDHWHEKAHIRQVANHACQIYLRLGNWAPRGMIHLVCHLAQHPGSGNGLAYNESVASINVSQAKTPGQVAKDIARRLLPTYEQQLERNQAHLEACNAYETQRKATEQAIEVIEQAYRVAHPYSSGRGYYLRLEADRADKVKLKVDGISLEMAEKLVKLLG
jgi:hypothetical protein